MTSAMAVSRVLLHWAPRRFLISQFVTGSISSWSGLDGQQRPQRERGRLHAAVGPAPVQAVGAPVSRRRHGVVRSCSAPRSTTEVSGESIDRFTPLTRLRTSVPRPLRRRRAWCAA